MPADSELEHLRLADERLRAFLRYSSEGIFMFEGATHLPTSAPVDEQIDRMLHEAVLGECNERMAEMYGASVDQLIGRSLHEFLGDSPANRAFLRAFVESGYDLHNMESEEPDRTGAMHVFSNSLVGVVEKGELVRAWGTQVDVTSLKQAERDLRTARDRLEMALDAGRIGILEYEPGSGRLSCDDRCRALLGMTSDRELDHDAFMSGVHPEDRKRVDEATRRLVEVGRELDIVHRTIGIEDGVLRWLHARGRVFSQPGGLRWTVTFRDTTKRQRERLQLERLAQENERLLGEAERALAIRDEFLSIASHELRTPLTALRVRLDRARPGNLLDEPLLEFLRRQVSRLTRLTRELVDVTRIDSGKLDLEPVRSDLVQVARDAVEEVSDEAHRTGTAVHLRAPERLEVTVDPEYTAQAIENLVGNAIKYGGGRPVEISVDAGDGQAEVRVHDEGIGISDEEQARIFQRFVRAAPARGYGGLGLGLYIVRRIAEAHGGTIAVESVPGHGSTFCLRLPMG